MLSTPDAVANKSERSTIVGNELNMDADPGGIRLVPVDDDDDDDDSLFAVCCVVDDDDDGCGSCVLNVSSLGKLLFSSVNLLS